MNSAEEKRTQPGETREGEGGTAEPFKPDTSLFMPAILVGLLWERGIAVPTHEGPHRLRRIVLALAELAALRIQKGEQAQLSLLGELSKVALAEAQTLREDTYTCLGGTLAVRLDRARKAPVAGRVRLTLALSVE